MRDNSIFQGIKELKNLLFTDNGMVWMVSELRDGAWLPVGKLLKIKNETNKALYERGKDLLYNDHE